MAWPKKFDKSHFTLSIHQRMFNSVKLIWTNENENNFSSFEN